jgi:hypothetical protein
MGPIFRIREIRGKMSHRKTIIPAIALFASFLLFFGCARPQSDNESGKGIEMLAGSAKWSEALSKLKNPSGVLPNGTNISGLNILYRDPATTYEFFVYDQNYVLILLSNSPLYFMRIETKEFQFHLKNELYQLTEGKTGTTKALSSTTYYKDVGDYSVEIYFTPNEMDFCTSSTCSQRYALQDVNSTTFVDLWRLYEAANSATFYTPTLNDQQIPTAFYDQYVAGKKRLILTDSSTVTNPQNFNLKSYGLNFSFMFGSDLKLTGNLLGCKDITDCSDYYFSDWYALTRNFAAFFSVPLGDGTSGTPAGLNQKDGIVVVIRGNIEKFQDFVTAQGVNLNETPVTPSSAPTAKLGDVVINEVGVSSGSNDFVEIFNKTGNKLNLAGLYLQRDSACNLGNGITEKITLSGTIPANGYYVVANSGNSLTNVDLATLGNIASGYCVMLTSNNTDVAATTDSNIIDWVTIAGAGSSENGSLAPDTGANGAISRMPNGTDTNMNAADFQVKAATPGSQNGSPTYTSSPASSATTVAVAANIVLTFNETMNTGVGTVNVSGTTSGAQNGLACAWSTTSNANDTCTINPPTDFTNNGETISVTLSGFLNTAAGLGPATTTFTFTVINAATTPTVTNITVTATNPNNGIIPYNIGTANITIDGTNFTGTTGVALDDTNGANTAVNTALTSVVVVNANQITAVVPAGVKPNPVTGWNVRVTNGGGTNATSTVTFKPRAPLLISEVLITGAAATNEFIELYNPTSNSINVCTIAGGGNIIFRRRTATGADSVLGSLTITNCTVPSHGFFLAISSVSTAIWTNFDATFTAALAANNMFYISTSSNLNGVIDLVGWGTITDSNPGGGCEGGNASCTNLASANNSIERKPAGGTGHATDTNVNSTDFNAQSATTTPRGTADAAQP